LHSQGFLHHFAHDFDRTFEIEALTWTHVQLKRNGIQFFLAMYRQVSALGQVLADQAINVFVAAALPRAVWVTEVDRHTGSLGDLGVLCHFPALVVGHALAHRQRHVIEGGAEALHCRGRRRVVHLHQHQVATSALHQRTYRRGVSLTLNKVAFPMPRHQSVFNFRRAQVNADHLWNLPAPIHTAKAWSTCRLALAQTKDQLLAQLTDGQGIDRVVDRLATDVGISKTGYVHTAQLAGNLLGRQTLAQHMDHQFKALTTWQQLSHGPTSLAADLHPLLSHAGRVAASCISIAAHLSADRRRGSVDQAGNPAQAEALGMTNLNGGTLCNAEFGIRHRAAPYRKGQVLHSVFAAAGLFDTVAAIGDPARGHMSVGDAKNPGVNLYLARACAKQVVHLTAADECRHNFSLNRVNTKYHEELVLPGVHSNLGGGYPSVMRERVLLGRPKLVRGSYYSLTGLDRARLQASIAWQQREAAEAAFRAKGLPGNGRFIKQELKLLPSNHRTTGQGSEGDVLLMLSMDRLVRGELSRVSLRVMHTKAVDGGVPFDTLNEHDRRFSIPNDLQPIASKVISAAMAGQNAVLSDSERHYLHGRYIHASANWNARWGFLPNKPRTDNQRAIYEDQQ